MAATVHHAPRARRPGRLLARLFVPLILLAVGAVIVIIVRSPPQFLRAAPTQQSHRAPARRLPPYWTVRPGDSLGLISAKTGLSIDLLQAYNPNVNPNALTPGQRLNLWRYPPQPSKPKAKPLGPMFWTVQPGQSFGSIAAATGINIVTLEQLNPRLTPGSVQPGDQVRLRR